MIVPAKHQKSQEPHKRLGKFNGPILVVLNNGLTLLSDDYFANKDRGVLDLWGVSSARWPNGDTLAGVKLPIGWMVVTKSEVACYSKSSGATA